MWAEATMLMQADSLYFSKISAILMDDFLKPSSKLMVTMCFLGFASLPDTGSGRMRLAAVAAVVQRNSRRVVCGGRRLTEARRLPQ